MPNMNFRMFIERVLTSREFEVAPSTDEQTHMEIQRIWDRIRADRDNLTYDNVPATSAPPATFVNAYLSYRVGAGRRERIRNSILASFGHVIPPAEAVTTTVGTFSAQFPTYPDAIAYAPEANRRNASSATRPVERGRIAVNGRDYANINTLIRETRLNIPSTNPVAEEERRETIRTLIGTGSISLRTGEILAGGIEHVIIFMGRMYSDVPHLISSLRLNQIRTRAEDENERLGTIQALCDEDIISQRQRAALAGGQYRGVSLEPRDDEDSDAPIPSNPNNRSEQINNRVAEDPSREIQYARGIVEEMGSGLTLEQNIDTICFGVEMEKCVEPRHMPEGINYYHSFGVNALKTDSSCGIEFTTGTESISKLPFFGQMLDDSVFWKRFCDTNGYFKQNRSGIHVHLSMLMSSDSEKRRICNNLQALCMLFAPFFGYGRIKNRYIMWSNLDRTSHYSVVNMRSNSRRGHFEIRAFQSSQDKDEIARKVELSALFLYLAFQKQVMTAVVNLLPEIFPDCIRKATSLSKFVAWRKTIVGKYSDILAKIRNHLGNNLNGWNFNVEVIRAINEGHNFLSRTISSNKNF